MMNMTTSSKIVIGITGTQGAGKDTAADFLVEQLGYIHFSLSDIVREETSQRCLEQVRDNWRTVADSLRVEFGNDVFAQRMVEKISTIDAPGFIITSFRHPSEVEVIKSAFPDFKLISIDAPIELRYERITSRGKDADKVSFEHFKEQEKKENVSTDIGMRIREVMQLADEAIMNTGDIDELKNNLSKILN